MDRAPSYNTAVAYNTAGLSGLDHCVDPVMEQIRLGVAWYIHLYIGRYGIPLNSGRDDLGAIKHIVRKQYNRSSYGRALAEHQFGRSIAERYQAHGSKDECAALVESRCHIRSAAATDHCTVVIQLRRPVPTAAVIPATVNQGDRWLLYRASRACGASGSCTAGWRHRCDRAHPTY